jgi:biotin carboxylase
MTRTLLLIGGITGHVAKAKSLGLRVILLQHPTKAEPAQHDLADHVEIMDFTDWPAVRDLVDQRRAQWRPDAILSLTEPGVENAARLNDRYGMGGTRHATARLLRDKAAMRAYLLERDPAALPARLLGDRAALDEFAARYGHPFVVKPTGATAGFAVMRVDGARDHDRVWAEVEARTGGTTDRGTTLLQITGFLMEQYVDGPEYSVESFSSDGRHVVVAITEKYVDPVSFTELGHAMPARVDPATEELIRRRVVDFLGLVGLTDGPAHTELRLGPSGPVIIESHCRNGGGAIADLVHGAYGLDLAELALARPFGFAPAVPGRPTPVAAAATRFLTGSPGTVASVSGVEQARADPRVLTLKVNVEPGDPVRPLNDNWDRLGLIAVTGSDPAAALEHAADLLENTIRVKIDHPDGTVSFAHAAPIQQPEPVAGPVDPESPR